MHIQLVATIAAASLQHRSPNIFANLIDLICVIENIKLAVYSMENKRCNEQSCWQWIWMGMLLLVFVAFFVSSRFKFSFDINAKPRKRPTYLIWLKCLPLLKNKSKIDQTNAPHYFHLALSLVESVVSVGVVAASIRQHIVVYISWPNMTNC